MFSLDPIATNTSPLRALRCFRAILQPALVAALLLIAVLKSPASTPDSLSFERDVRPILKAHCFQCHGEGEKPKGGVDLRQRRLMLTNSESGPIMVPHHPNRSVLIQRVTSGEMPKSDKKLSTTQIAILERWIQQGAPTLRPEPTEVPRFLITEEDRNFWAFRPIQTKPPPDIVHKDSARTPIDRFLLSALEAQGLSFAPEASRAQLLRRVTYDLTGLPPQPQEIREFLNDTRSDAYERWVDRLLASSSYGEHWARHWLDVAGYADSNGGIEADSERAWAWRYRDYVIKAFNSDMPFDRFITEQLAGDELVQPPFGELTGESLDKVIATGFLRMAPDPTADGPPDPPLARNQVIADTLQIVSSSLLGLTVQCAQCHDHRYDPISQADYYRMRAIFEPAFDWKNWKSPGERQISLMPPEDRATAACIEHAAGGIDAEAQQLHDSLIEQFVQKQLLLIPEHRREEVMAARRAPAAKRTEEHKKLLREFPTFQDHIILSEVNVEGAKSVESVRARAGVLRGMKPPDPMVHCLIEEPGKQVETVLFHRGDPQQPREVLAPGNLTVLSAEDRPALNAVPSARKTTGRRLAFARLITQPEHPLTSRVLVNRVWHHFFGTGLVATMGDFGALGERPTHPELLDWLAHEMVSSGWKMKSLQRLIVTSAAYRQGSINTSAQSVDPANKLLGRMRIKRLTTESVRDSLLAVSGRLNGDLYGPPTPVAITPQGQVVVGAQKRDGNGDPTGIGELGASEFRRSLYIQVRRSLPVSVMEPFDTPTLTPNCEARPISTVTPQALMLMNDQFVIDRAQDLAQRLRSERPGGARAQISLLWEILFAEPPKASELERSLIFLAEQSETLRTTTMRASESAGAKKEGKDKTTSQPDSSLLALTSLCQALLGSNRFLYLE